MIVELIITVAETRSRTAGALVMAYVPPMRPARRAPPSLRACALPPEQVAIILESTNCGDRV